MMPLPTRGGATLLELLVALAVLAVALTIAAASFRLDPVVDDGAGALVSRAREEALRTRRVVRFAASREGEALTGSAYPDGRVLLSDSAGMIEPMSGRPHVR
jgi:prepilin-type N-terminal cleavage/methylation domain-containing protein